MLATSRMWPSTRWMHAVWWRQLPAEAPARKRRLGKPAPFRTTFPHERLHHVHTFSSQPIRRWPCLIRSGRAVAAVAPVAEEAGVVAAVGEVVQVEAEQAAVAVGAVVRAEAAPEVAVKAALAEVVVPEVVVKAALAEVVVPEVVVKAAPEAVAREAGHAVAAGTILAPIILATRPTTSRGLSCRHSHLRLRPTSRSLRRWRKERADSRFSIPTTCWVDSNALDESKTSSTSWGTCPATRRKEAATR